MSAVIVGFTLFLLIFGGADARFKIVNGFPLSILNTPWQVSIMSHGWFHCGGSIISPVHILSAAHCFRNVTAQDVTVRSGSVSDENGGFISIVREIVSHPKFGLSTFADFDVAVLILAEALQFSVSTDAIILSGYEAVPGDMALVSGWGRLSFGGPSPHKLQGAFLEIIHPALCQNNFGNLITPRMICAYAEGKSVCMGDSGGPLVIRTGLIGVVSHGGGCLTPGVFTNVLAFRSFIDKVTDSSARWS